MIVPKDIEESLPWLEKNWKRLDCLDVVPKKTVGQQVHDLILMGEQLQESRLAMLNLPDCSEDCDPDDFSDELDEFSDLEDVRQACCKVSSRGVPRKTPQKNDEALKRNKAEADNGIDVGKAEATAETT